MGGMTAAAGLIDRTALRSMVGVRRGDGRDYPAPAEPDPALIELVESPFESVPAVTARLDRLETRLRDRADRRAVFLSIYVRMTEHVASAIEAGRFADADWMGRYLVTFADYYRRGSMPSTAARWRRSPNPGTSPSVPRGRERRSSSRTPSSASTPHQLRPGPRVDRGGDRPDREEKYRDHRTINDVLARIFDLPQEALADLYAAGLEDVDTALGQVD